MLPDDPKRASDPHRLWQLAVVLLPVVVMAVLAARLWLSGLPQLFVEHDMAILELYTRNVCNGGQLLGAYSRFGFHHPGPLLFYLYAPAYELTGQTFSALLATAVTLNTACVAAGVALLWHTGGRRLAAWCAATLGLYLVFLEPDVLCSAWNPHVAILPYALTLLAVGCFLAGARWALVVGAAAGSVAVQAHVSFAAPLASVLAVTATLLVARVLRRRPPIDGAGWKGLAGPVATATLLASALWLPVVIEEITRTPGNITRLVRFAARAPGDHTLVEALEAIGSWTGAFLLAPAGWSSRTSLAGAASALALAAGAAIVLGLVIVTVRAASSGRERAERALAAVVLVSLAGAAVTTSRISGPMHDHLLRWISVHGPLAVAVILSRALPLRLDATHSTPRGVAPRLIGVLPMLLAAAAAVGLAVKVVRFEPLQAVAKRPQYQRIRRLADDVDSRLTAFGAVAPQVHSGASECLYDVAGISLQLIKRGYRLSADPRLGLTLGPQLLRPGADSFVVLAPPAALAGLEAAERSALHDTAGPCSILVASELSLADGTVRFGSPTDVWVLDGGFYAPERDGDTTFRWSRGASCSVVVPLAPGRDHLVEVEAAPFPVAGRTQRLRLTVNGSPLAAHRMRAGTATYRWPLPARLVDAQNVLVLSFAYTASPHELGRSNDRRQLAVRLFSLRAVPTDEPRPTRLSPDEPDGYHATR